MWLWFGLQLLNSPWVFTSGQKDTESANVAKKKKKPEINCILALLYRFLCHCFNGKFPLSLISINSSTQMLEINDLVNAIERTKGKKRRRWYSVGRDCSAASFPSTAALLGAFVYVGSSSLNVATLAHPGMAGNASNTRMFCRAFSRLWCLSHHPCGVGGGESGTDDNGIRTGWGVGSSCEPTASSSKMPEKAVHVGTTATVLS